MNSRVFRLLCFMILAGFALTGCPEPSENGENGGSNIIIPDGDDDDGDGDEDADGDADSSDPCAGVSCEIGEVCVEGVCEANADEGYSCAEPFDLGTLGEAGEFSMTVNPAGQPNVLNTSCSVDDESPQAVFRFEVDSPSRISFDVARTEPDVPIPVIAKELRVGGCAAEFEEEWCTINPQTFDALPGQEYFLIAEANQGPDINFFDLKYEVEPLACAPAGIRTCVDGEILSCVQGGMEERVFSCPGECANEEECAGNRCEVAFEVRESQTITGDWAGFVDSFDMSESPSCTSDQTIGVDTPGRDMVIGLPDLVAGQMVRFDKGDLGLAVLGIMEDCQESAAVCIAADTNTGALDWEVPADGNYYLVVAPRSVVSGSFEFTIEIEDAQ